MKNGYPIPTPIYHITHIKNLEKILEAEGLKSITLIKRDNVEYINIAHQNIQDRRATTPVPLSPFGNLHDYVPFYFAPRSPMLYAIYRGNVEGYEEGQEPVIYLKTHVQEAVNAGLKCLFTDGHAIMIISNFYDKLDELQNVDWEIMNSKYWNDTPMDSDRKRRRQAEFLVYEFFPWSVIQEIGVMNRRMQEKVQKILSRFGVHKPVFIKREWYY